MEISFKLVVTLCTIIRDSSLPVIATTTIQKQREEEVISNWKRLVAGKVQYINSTEVVTITLIGSFEHGFTWEIDHSDKQIVKEVHKICRSVEHHLTISQEPERYYKKELK